MRHLVFGLVMALLLSSSAISAGPGASAFITNGTTSVSVLDTANALSAVSVGAGTQGVAMDPKGARAYVVASNGSPSSVYAIDATTKEWVSVPFPTTVRSPFGVAVSPDGTRLFVTHGVKSGFSSVQGAVSVINVTVSGTGTATLSLGPTLMLGGGATGVAVSPSGNRVYVANTSQRVSVIDPAKIGVMGQQPLIANIFAMGSTFTGVAVAPDGTLFAADYGSDKLLVLSIAGITADARVDCTTPAPPLVACVGVGSGPFGVAASANGKRVFVANAGTNTVTVIDPAKIGTPEGPVVATPIVGAGPHGVAVTSDSAKAYVVSRTTTPPIPPLPQIPPSVSVLDGLSGGLLATIDLPANSSPVGFGNFLARIQSINVVINFVPGAINLKKQGTVPVIMYGSDGSNPEFPAFDVHTVELSTVCFYRWGVKEKPTGERMANYGDFNGDGLDDVMVHIAMDHVDENCAQYPEASLSNPVATLVGESSAGHFHGLDDKVKFVH